MRVSRGKGAECIRHREGNLFLRGIVPMIGYQSAVGEQERGERFTGKSKYPLKKMLSFAGEGIPSPSGKPIRLITGLGILLFLVTIVMLAYFLCRQVLGATAPGWASVLCSVWAVGGLILLSPGILGEYRDKICLETRGRPRFLIREILDGGGKGAGAQAAGTGEQRLDGTVGSSITQTRSKQGALATSGPIGVLPTGKT